MNEIDYLIKVIKDRRYLSTTSLKILIFLVQEPRTAGRLARDVGLADSTIYGWLSNLKQQGLVQVDKKGNAAGIYDVR